MSRFRDIKRQARRDVHDTMHVPALYIPAPNATPVPCTVRVWRRRDDPMTGTLQGGAQMSVSEDRLRFLRSDLPAYLRTGSIVSVEVGEAYKIDFWYPVDDELVTARVVPLTPAEAVSLPVPS